MVEDAREQREGDRREGADLSSVGARAEDVDERSKDCVMCHITWGDDWSRLEAELPDPSVHVTIDGYDERNATSEMCFSCHDGYVADDRVLFGYLPEDAHQGAWDKAPKGLELRLDNQGQLYCGTCHSPHDHKMGRSYSYEPFLRRDIDRSQLCLECHVDHTGAGSHSLHKTLADGLSVPGAPEETAGRVECLSCHQFHSASHLRLAPREPVASLCITCHQDQKAVGGSGHDLGRAPLDPSPARSADGTPADSDLCLSCHQVHGAKGPDLWARDLNGIPAGPGEDRRCLECHSAEGLAKDHAHARGGHPLGMAAPAGAKGRLPLPDQRVGCVTCHDPHRQGGSADHPGDFLRSDGPSAAGLCITCHQDQAQVTRSPHGPEQGGFLAAARQLASDSGARPATAWDCLLCHQTHGDRPYSLDAATGPTADAGLCLSCHSPHAPVQGLADAPSSIGAFSHPLGEPAGGSLVKDRDPQAPLGCVSCHDPHTWSPAGLAWAPGTEGTEGSSFLHADNRQGALCLTCHSDQQHAASGPHRAAAPRDGSACVGCHTPHNAAQDGLMQARASVGDRSLLLASSPWPKGSREWLDDSWNDGDRACLACHSNPAVHTRVPMAWAHPRVTLGETGVAREAADGTQPVTCITCHDPHHEAEGLIARPSAETPCATCHGDQALWRYRHYHDPERRKP